VKQLVRQRRIVAPLFRILARPSFIRQVLAKAYPSGANIDAELVEILHRAEAPIRERRRASGDSSIFSMIILPLSCWQTCRCRCACSGASGPLGKPGGKRWSGVNNSTAFRS